MTVEESGIGLEKASSALKLLGDKTRLTMIKLLEENDLCGCEFVEILGISQPAVSQHMRKLKDVGLVEENRQGQWVFYSLKRDGEIAEMVFSILRLLPDQAHYIAELESKGRRVECGR
ncbi:MAG: ArsR/SmtB family transcription factor [Bacillota bacterium]